MKKLITLKVDGVSVKVPAGSTILDAADSAGVKIPTLCYIKDINKIGACRMCLVEVKGQRNLVTACTFPASEGMEVITNSPKVIDSRRSTLELLLSNHPFNCTSCERNENCELQALANLYDCQGKAYAGDTSKAQVDTSSTCYVRDNSRCIMCRKCEAICKKCQSVGVLGANGRGFNVHIGTTYDNPIAMSGCVNCGQCVVNCPTGALYEKSSKDDVIKAIFDDNKYTVIAMAPSVRVSLGEIFNLPYGTNVEKKAVTAFKRMGFDAVFDIDFGADLTIMEESEEFLGRLQTGRLPMFTSCCPGWVNYIEHFYPEFIDNLSTCKSPQGMFGSIVKSYYAKKLNKKPEDFYVVSVMPCVAKKGERLREPWSNGKTPDIDAVLTVRECGELIKQAGIDLKTLKDTDFDLPLGAGSGAGVIFGNTGGVMEAALRSVADRLENRELQEIDYTLVRGLKGVKEAELTVAGKKVKIAVASGLNNAKKLLYGIKCGKLNYDFVEVMACPGGCVNGGGMPIISSYIRRTKDVIGLRAKALYKSDYQNEIRKSHKNPYIVNLYKEYLGVPNSKIAHRLLHTKYVSHKKEGL